jgi:hypothetical protein
MRADEGAAHRVAGAIAAQDPLLAHDLVALARAYLSSWGIDSWNAHHHLDDGAEEIPRIVRLQAFGAALEQQTGGEGAVSFVVDRPRTRGVVGGERDVRAIVQDYVRIHGEDAARRDVAVFLYFGERDKAFRAATTGTLHKIEVERFF